MNILKGSHSSIIFSFIYSLFSSSWNFDFILDYFISTLARPDSLFQLLLLASSKRESKFFNFCLS
jgi:hypothetical protein